MRATRVFPSSASPQLPLAVIAGLSCALSFWLTVRFCAELAPGQTVYELLAIGVIWELSKVTFGAMGMHSTPLTKRVRALLLIVVMVLALGSIASSMGFLVQTQNRIETVALEADPVYKTQKASLTLLNTEMTLLATSAANDLNRRENYGSRGLKTIKHLDGLRAEADHKAADLTERKALPNVKSSSAFFFNIGSMLPGDANTNASRLRLGAQCTLAIVLELVSLIALALVRSHRAATGSSAPPLHAVRPTTGAAARCIDTNAAACIETDAPGKRAGRHARAGAGRGDTATDIPGKDHQYQEAKQLVAARALNPSLRALQDRLGICQSTAERFLRGMVQEGMLTKSRRAHNLVAAS